MKKLSGKRLLILGSNIMASEMVEYARLNGAYTFVLDYLPTEKSKAKQLADEAIMISTANTEAIIDFCRQRKIDGIYAGISEFNLLQAMRISEALGLRYVFNRSQWDTIEKKDKFRDLCMKYEVPCPQRYYSGDRVGLTRRIMNSFKYPLVVKPVDCAASLGVAICKTNDEIEGAIDSAFAASDSKTIIVEEYVHGHEFTAHYTICNGHASLSCIDNRYPVAVHNGEVTTIPIARVYPSLFTTQYLKDIDKKLVALCNGLGVDYGVLFIQGMYNEEEQSFSIFEAGLRSAAESPCRFLEKITGQNHLMMIIDYILTGVSDYDLKKEQPSLKGKCCGVVSLVTTGGEVGKIVGLNETVQTLPSVIQFESRYPVGSIAPSGDTLRQLMIRFVMICNNRKDMQKDIDYINSHVFVTDINGQNMILKMKSNRLFALD